MTSEIKQQIFDARPFAPAFLVDAFVAKGFEATPPVFYKDLSKWLADKGMKLDVTFHGHSDSGAYYHIYIRRQDQPTVRVENPNRRGATLYNFEFTTRYPSSDVEDNEEWHVGLVTGLLKALTLI